MAAAVVDSRGEETPTAAVVGDSGGKDASTAAVDKKAAKAALLEHNDDYDAALAKLRAFAADDEGIEDLDPEVKQERKLYNALSDLKEKILAAKKCQV